jgi:ferredoxin
VEARAREYFSVPDQPEYENTPFILDLVDSGQRLEVPADRSAAEALSEVGIEIITKCSDGLCGTCAVSHEGDDIEHRDFVLSNSERESKIILCCSRAKEENGVVRVNL